MFLLQLLLVFIGISHLANSSPHEIPFQQLLDACTKPEYSNSTQCQYFFSTYPWRNGDIRSVFYTIINIRAHTSSAWNSLNERLIPAIENPNFDLTILGERPFYFAVNGNSELLAIAIWQQLEKYKNEATKYSINSDLQLFECHRSMDLILERKMFHLAKKMVADKPDCLLQDFDVMSYALRFSNRDIREFIVDLGLEVLPRHLEEIFLKHEDIEWALLNYRHSNDLIKNSIRNDNELVAIAILEFLKQKDCTDQLFQICNEAVFDAVKTNKVELLKSMLRYCPSCILLNGDTLMDIAINGGNCTLPMIQLLNLYGVEIPPNHIHKAQSLGFTGEFENDILDCQFLIRGVRYSYDTFRRTIESYFSKFGSFECVEAMNLRYSISIDSYFNKAVEENKNEIRKIILTQDGSGIDDILPRLGP